MNICMCVYVCVCIHVCMNICIYVYMCVHEYMYICVVCVCIHVCVYEYMLLLLFSHSIVSDSATPWTAARQASLSLTISWSLLKLTSTESVIPSNHLTLCFPFSSCLQSFTASGSFLKSRLLSSGGQNIGASASASVFPMNIQDWFPVGLTGLISLQSKGLSRVFSSTTVQKQQFFSTQPSLQSNSHTHTWLLEKP